MKFWDEITTGVTTLLTGVMSIVLFFALCYVVLRWVHSTFPHGHPTENTEEVTKYETDSLSKKVEEWHKNYDYDSKEVGTEK